MLLGGILRERDHRVTRGIDGAEDCAVHDKVEVELHLVVPRHDDHDGIGVPGRRLGRFLGVALPLGVDVHIARERRVKQGIGGEGLVPLAFVPIPPVELVALFDRVLRQCDRFLPRRVDGVVDLSVYDEVQFEFHASSARRKSERETKNQKHKSKQSDGFHYNSTLSVCLYYVTNYNIPIVRLSRYNSLGG